MSVVEDVRKVVQDLVAPDLKAIAAELAAQRAEIKLRDEAMQRDSKLRDELTQLKIEALSNKMDAQYASIMYALNLDKRVESLERQSHSAPA